MTNGGTELIKVVTFSSELTRCPCSIAEILKMVSSRQMLYLFISPRHMPQQVFAIMVFEKALHQLLTCHLN